MNEFQHHDQIIARIQKFADDLDLIRLEKEALLMALQDETEMVAKMMREIDLYEEIQELYDKSFGDILFK